MTQTENGNSLDAPPNLTLRDVANWSRFYGGGDSPQERLRNARYLRLTERKRMPWLEGLAVYIRPNDDLSRALYISGLYEPSTMLVLRRMLGPGSTFVDVGANAGLFSMIAARWVEPAGRVYAFEPSKREYGRLVDHLALNGLTNVTPIRQALAGREGPVQLRVASFPNAGHNTLGMSFAYEGVRTERIESVHATTLDRFVELHGVERVDAIKLDIEGSEYAALSGCSSVLDRFRPVLIVELSPAALARCASTPELVVERLTAARYRLYSIGAAAELIPLAFGDAGSNGDVVAIPTEKGLV